MTALAPTASCKPRMAKQHGRRDVALPESGSGGWHVWLPGAHVSRFSPRSLGENPGRRRTITAVTARARAAAPYPGDRPAGNVCGECERAETARPGSSFELEHRHRAPRRRRRPRHSRRPSLRFDDIAISFLPVTLKRAQCSVKANERKDESRADSQMSEGAFRLAANRHFLR